MWRCASPIGRASRPAAAPRPSAASFSDVVLRTTSNPPPALRKNAPRSRSRRRVVSRSSSACNPAARVRDQLVADRLRPALRAGGEHRYHHGRYRYRPRGRRLAFRPVDASCRHGVFARGPGSDRQREEIAAIFLRPHPTRSHSRAAASPHPPPIEASTFLSWRRNRAARLTEGVFGGLRVTKDNEMTEQVFPNGAGVCEAEVDPETGRVQHHTIRLR